MTHKTWISTISLLTLVMGVGSTATPSWAETGRSVLLAQNTDRAEEVCRDAVEDEGFRVEDVVNTNEYSGGAEVIMEVSRRRENIYVGCDYSSATREVDLYRVEDPTPDDENADRDRGNERWRSAYSNEGRISNQDDAESVARELVGSQLGIDDPQSDIIEIDEVRRTDNDRAWLVEGNANGAPFEVRIRANDAYILDFQVF